MKCVPIKLEYRKKLQKNFKRKTPNNQPNPENRCSFSCNSRKASPIPPRLTITNLILPSNIQPFNTGASIERWANKRTRLKSGKKPLTRRTIIIETPPSPEGVANCEGDEDEHESANEVPQELDPDIRKLLEESANEERGISDLSRTKSYESGESVKSKRGHKGMKEKRKRGKRVRSKKLVKTVSFTLSKPPSPETEQVIRVEVISNYSIDLRDEDSESDADGDGVEDHPNKNPNALFNKRKINRTSLVRSSIPKLNNRKEDFLIHSKKVNLLHKK